MSALSDCLGLVHKGTRVEFALPEEAQDRLLKIASDKRRALDRRKEHPKNEVKGAIAAVQSYLDLTREDLASAEKAKTVVPSSSPAQPAAPSTQSSTEPPPSSSVEASSGPSAGSTPETGKGQGFTKTELPPRTEAAEASTKASEARLAPVTKAATDYFGGSLPNYVTVVHEPSATWDARYANGHIELNAAKVSLENVGGKIEHEIGHHVWTDPKFRADFDKLWESLEPESRKLLSDGVDRSYSKQTPDTRVEETRMFALEVIRRRAAEGNPVAISAWKKVVEFIKAAWKRITGTDHADPAALAARIVATGKKMLEDHNGGTDTGVRHSMHALNDLTGHTKEVARKFLEVPRFTPLKRVVNGWVGRMQASSIAVRSAMKEIERMVPDATRREGVTNWIQAAGDDAVLAAREAQSTGARQRGYRAARELTPKEKALAQRVRSYYDAALTKAQSFGLVNEGIENYVNQVWKRPLTPKGANALAGFTGQLSRNFKFGQKRSFENFFEGEKAGFEPVTKDVSKLLGLYLTELNKTIATREMIANLTTGAASDGRPLAVPEGSVLPQNPDADGFTTLVLPGAKPNVKFEGTEYDVRDYRSPDAPALAKWKFVASDTDGNPVSVLGRLAIHPEAYKTINNALSQSAITKWAREQADGIPGHLARLAVRVADSLQSQVKASMMSLSPFHIVQEGTHAIGHKVNPFTNIPTIDYSNPAHVDAMNHGLMLAGDRASMAQFMDGFTPKGSWIEKIPWLGTWQRGVSEFTFDHYIPGLKYKTYEHSLARNMARYDKEMKSGQMTPDDVKYLTAKQMNAAYGHMNYKDLGRNPTFQHFLRMIFLAPDFLEARAKFTGQAIQGLAGQKMGREQLVAMATLAVTFYVAARVMNGALNNGDTKNDLDHLFTVEAGGRIYTMRSVPEDIYRMLHGEWIFPFVPVSRQFVAGRVSPLVGTGALEGIFGINYRGEKVTNGQALQDVLTTAIPMSTRMIPGLRDLTRTQRNHPVSPWEQFMGAMGIQIARHSPIIESQKNAHKFMDAMGVENTGSYPVSQYQQLRYALEDQNWDKAKEEVKRLMPQGVKRSDLRNHFHESLFHVWTQSKKMDAQWKSTLMGEQKAMLEEAEQRRKDVWARFVKILDAGQ